MLSELIQKRDELIKQLDKDGTRIGCLDKDEKVNEYKILTNSIASNRKELTDLNFQIKQEKMRNCSHIFVIGHIDKVWDGHRTDTYKYRGCIKCGLDERYLSYDYSRCETPLQQEMKFIFNETKKNGISITEICSLDLGMAIYKGILKSHPDITDKMAIRYFYAALHSIRINDVNRNVGVSRIKRLGLYPNFRAWSADSVICRG